MKGVAEGGVYLQGLQCVTVLVGVFDLSTGEPVVGVVNQPFWRCDPNSGQWSGRQVWGVSIGGQSIASLPPPLSTGPTLEKNVCVVSGSDMEVMEALKRAGWTVLPVCGAGYKQLCVIDGVASAFLLTKSSCYKWDTCGPHAILRACGGGMVSWGRVKEEGRVREEMALRYHCPDVKGLTGPQQWRNDGGVLAYARETICAAITDTLV